MATFFPGESHTFSEYLLVPGYSSAECVPTNVSLKTPLTRFKRGDEPEITLNIPMALRHYAVRLRRGHGRRPGHRGRHLLHLRFPDPRVEAAMVKAVKDHKAGFVQSDSTLTPDMTMEPGHAAQGPHRSLHHARYR